MKLGLENVVVAETSLSRVDGQAGSLLIAGTELNALAQLSFEDMGVNLGHRAALWGQLRVEAYRELEPHANQLQKASPLDALVLGLSLLPAESNPDALIASLPVLLALARNGDKTPRPDASQGQVADFLHMFTLDDVSKGKVAALSSYLVTVSEHGMNASTFTCRVVASTGASHRAATLAALAALSGPLHGGAPGPVLDLLDELAASECPGQLLCQKVKAGERLMGFGHRVYKTRDPRAEVVQRAVHRLNDSERLEHAIKMERLAQEVLAELKPGRILRTNVEFYTAVLLKELGFEREWFTPLFAMGRILGWMAHFREQRETGRLMRPKARYVGKIPEANSKAEEAAVAPA